jgi:uncharacterized membrane protein YbhN (UPF0104 family)
VFVLEAVAVYVLSTLVYAVRTCIILRRAGVRIRLRDSYIAYLFNIFVNNITPSARAGGELVRAAFIARRYGLSIASTVNVVAFERATEALGIVVLIGVSVVYGVFDKRSTWYLLVLSVLIVSALYVVYRFWDRIFETVLERLEKRGWVGSGLGGVMRLSGFFRDRLLLLLGVVFGVAVWFLDAVRLYLIGLAVGVDMGIIGYIGVSVLYAAIGVLAVTPGGLGIVEGGLTAVLVALGVAADDALAITLIERLISYGLGTLLGAMGLLAAGGMKAWRALRSQ